MKKILTLGFTIFIIIIVYNQIATDSVILAQDDNSPIELHGFLLGTYSGRTGSGHSPSGGDYILAEERFRLELSQWFDSSNFIVKTDFYHDSIDDEFDLNVREAYIDYSYRAFDFRFGRQILTWGIGDLLFINDTFPKDWEAFFSGKPLEYLKVGIDGIKIRHSGNFINSELVIVPFFESDQLPSSDRFYIFNPFPSIPFRFEKKPDRTYNNTEVVLRLYRRIFDADVSLYFYRGFWKQPSALLDDFLNPFAITFIYPELSVFGISAQKSIFSGVLGVEAGFYDSREDSKGNNPLIPNSQIRALIGYSRQLWSDFTLGIQYYVENMQDYDAYKELVPLGFPKKHHTRHLWTLRLTQFLKYHTWKLSLFGYYSPTEKDYYFIPDVSRKINDHFSIAFGANIFGGEDEATFFGQFSKNDNLYANIRYDF